MNKLLNYNQSVPRYTSYPTANHFSNQITAAHYKKWLAQINNAETISLYIHVPYCMKLCWYCGCHTNIIHKYEPVKTYISYLKKEISLICSEWKKKRVITSIHFGGGTPSLIKADDFNNLMNFIHTSFDVHTNAQIAIEIDPRQLDETQVKAYVKQGVNRVSLGIQDFHYDVQEAIGRVQSYEQVQKTVSLLKSHGLDSINFDLIYGLPKQKLGYIAENIECAMQFNPTRISFFGYAHVPWMKKHMSLIREEDLPSADLRLEMFELAVRELKKHKYLPVGLDHFVQDKSDMAIFYRRHNLKRNFQGYSTEEGDNLIGIGVSSIGETEFGYVQNYSHIKDYYEALDKKILPVTRGISLTKNDKIRREIISQLMCYLTIDLQKIIDSYCLPKDSFADILFELSYLAQESLLTLSDKMIYIHSEKRQIVRYVCSLFDEYFQGNLLQKHSQVA